VIWWNHGQASLLLFPAFSPPARLRPTLGSPGCGTFPVTEDASGTEDEVDEEGEAAPGGLAVPALADGIGAAAGYYVGGPGGAAIGGAAVPCIHLLPKPVNALLADRTPRAEKMMGTARGIGWAHAGPARRAHPGAGAAVEASPGLFDGEIAVREHAG